MKAKVPPQKKFVTKVRDPMGQRKREREASSFQFVFSSLLSSTTFQHLSIYNKMRLVSIYIPLWTRRVCLHSPTYEVLYLSLNELDRDKGTMARTKVTSFRNNGAFKISGVSSVQRSAMHPPSPLFHFGTDSSAFLFSDPSVLSPSLTAEMRGSTAFFPRPQKTVDGVTQRKSGFFSPICTGSSLSSERIAAARGEGRGEVDQRGKKLESLFSLRYCE